MHDIIAGRRSVRFFKKDPIAESDMKEILRAGQWAPSPKNRQPWKFIVVKGMSRDMMIRLMEKGIERSEAGEGVLPGDSGLIANARFTMECMKKAPVEKITVKEITEECGVTRQTFYRNFQDKYNLINWYFDKILIESFAHMGEGKTVYEALVNKFHYIQEEKLFFKAAFKNDTQNCLRDHDFELIREFYKNQIEEKSGKTMSEHLQFQLEMYCQGSIYMTVQWVLGEMKESPENLAHALAQSMPEELAKVFRELEML